MKRYLMAVFVPLLLGSLGVSIIMGLVYAARQMPVNVWPYILAAPFTWVAGWMLLESEIPWLTKWYINGSTKTD
jgi:hypothetical protein